MTRRGRPPKKSEVTDEPQEDELIKTEDESKDDTVNETVEESITLQNWAVENNITRMSLAGFQAELGMGLQDTMKYTEFEKAYKKYRGKPGFIKPKEEG